MGIDPEVTALSKIENLCPGGAYMQLNILAKLIILVIIII